MFSKIPISSESGIDAAQIVVLEWLSRMRIDFAHNTIFNVRVDIIPSNFLEKFLTYRMLCDGANYFEFNIFSVSADNCHFMARLHRLQQPSRADSIVLRQTLIKINLSFITASIVTASPHILKKSHFSNSFHSSYDIRFSYLKSSILIASSILP